MKKTISIFCLVIFSIALNAQSERTADRIYLKDGGFLRGELVKIPETGQAKIRLVSGAEVVLPIGEIDHILPAKKERLFLENGKSLPSKGTYFDIQASYLFAKYAFENFQGSVREGISLSMSAGHQFNPKLKLGLGAAIDMYEGEAENELYMPIFLNIGGSLPNRKITPTYGMQIGYALPVQEWRETFNDEAIRYRGGWHIFPSVGLILPSRRNVNFEMGVGYKFQKLEKEREQFWWFSGTTHDKIWLKSLAVRFGVSF